MIKRSPASSQSQGFFNGAKPAGYRMYQKMKVIFQWIFLLIALSIFLYGFHVYTARPLDFERWWYPFKAAYASQHIHCVGDQSLASILKESIWKLRIPAGQVVMIKNDNLSHCEATWDGRWSVEPLVAKETRFRFASLTKPVVAASFFAYLEQAKQQGNVSINEKTKLADIIKLPESLKDPRINQITLKDLIGHSSGLKEENPRHGMFVYARQSWCPNDLKRLANIQLEYEPGLEVSYANANYCLLNLVLQLQTGKNWYELANEFFQLSQYDLQLIPEHGYLPDEVHYSFLNSDLYTDNYYKYVDLHSGLPVLGLSGSAIQLARFWNDKVLSNPEVTHALLAWNEQQHCTLDAVDKCYMHGLAGYYTNKGNRVYLHTGKIHGATALMAINEHKDIFVWVGNGNSKHNAKKKIPELINTLETHTDFFW